MGAASVTAIFVHIWPVCHRVYYAFVWSGWLSDLRCWFGVLLLFESHRPSTLWYGFYSHSVLC